MSWEDIAKAEGITKQGAQAAFNAAIRKIRSLGDDPDLKFLLGDPSAREYAKRAIRHGGCD